MRHGRTGVLAASVLLAIMAGCTSSPAPTPTPSAPSSPSALGKLAVGDCLGSLAGDSFDLADVESTPCTGAHNWEVSQVVPLTGETYPGEIDLKGQADTECATGFTEYLGAQPGYSRYSSRYLVPDENAWADQTNRRVVCLVGSPTDQLSASIKGDRTLFPTVGECLMTQDKAKPPTIVACSTAHEYEAYADQEWTGKAAPTTTEWDSLYTKVCVANFTKFVGLDVGRSSYEIAAFIAPTDAWSSIADHRIVCTVGTPGGSITGSVKGTKK